MSSAYMYFVAAVFGMSYIYILKSIGARTEPWGTPFLMAQIRCHMFGARLAKVVLGQQETARSYRERQLVPYISAVGNTSGIRSWSVAFYRIYYTTRRPHQEIRFRIPPISRWYAHLYFVSSWWRWTIRRTKLSAQVSRRYSEMGAVKST